MAVQELVLEAQSYPIVAQEDRQHQWPDTLVGGHLEEEVHWSESEDH